MSGTTWTWQVRGRHREVHTYGSITCWGDRAEQHTLADRWADDKLALLMYDAEPRWERLKGWTVTLRSEHGDQVTAYADEWLDLLRSGPLARMRDRLELLPAGRGRS